MAYYYERRKTMVQRLWLMAYPEWRAMKMAIMSAGTLIDNVKQKWREW